ncbi:MAG TPA: hypothetical protein VIM30_02730 [Candidatus Limnocylindrales bacterium]
MSEQAMGVTVIQAELECPNCLRATHHEVHYVAGLLHRLDCHVCGQRWEISHRRLRDRYFHDVPGRIRSKPARLAREARRRPLAFALGMPIRLFSKPARVAGEVGAVAGMLDE